MRRNGYLQRWEEVAQQKQANATYAWQQVGDYIREHSEPTDKMYVWGWYSGHLRSGPAFQLGRQGGVHASTGSAGDERTRRRD